MCRVIPCDQNNPDMGVFSAVAQDLLGCGVIVMPTDSVYGIGCVATPFNPARERIFKIKHRDPAQTLPLLLNDVDELDRLAVDVPDWARELARRFWPGALTLVVKASDAVPEEYRRAEDGSVALRVPDSMLVRALAARVHSPLAVTSANTHGMPSPVSCDQIEASVVADADITLDGGATPGALASTIVGCIGDGPVILREGVIPRASIEEAVRCVMAEKDSGLSAE